MKGKEGRERSGMTTSRRGLQDRVTRPKQYMKGKIGDAPSGYPRAPTIHKAVCHIGQGAKCRRKQWSSSQLRLPRLSWYPQHDYSDQTTRRVALILPQFLPFCTPSIRWLHSFSLYLLTRSFLFNAFVSR
jgi:hypothetical protein